MVGFGIDARKRINGSGCQFTCHLPEWGNAELIFPLQTVRKWAISGPFLA